MFHPDSVIEPKTLKQYSTVFRESRDPDSGTRGTAGKTAKRHCFYALSGYSYTIDGQDFIPAGRLSIRE
jgi:hypothetical protein